MRLPEFINNRIEYKITFSTVAAQLLLLTFIITSMFTISTVQIQKIEEIHIQRNLRSAKNCINHKINEEERWAKEIVFDYLTLSHLRPNALKNSFERVDLKGDEIKFKLHDTVYTINHKGVSTSDGSSWIFKDSIALVSKIDESYIIKTSRYEISPGDTVFLKLRIPLEVLRGNAKNVLLSFNEAKDLKKIVFTLNNKLMPQTTKEVSSVKHSVVNINSTRKIFEGHVIIDDNLKWGLYLEESNSSLGKILNIRTFFLLAIIFVVIFVTIVANKISIRALIVDKLGLLEKIMNKSWIEPYELKELISDDEVGKLTKTFQKLSYQISRRIEMEELSIAISKDMAKVINSDYSQVIDGVLKKIGIYTKTDRVFIFMLQNNNQVITVKNVWSRRGVNYQDITKENYQFSVSNSVHKELSAGKTIINLSKEYDFECKIMEDSTGFAAIPIIIEEELIGGLVCDTYISNFVWSSYEEQFLSLISEIIGFNIERVRTQKIIEEQREHINQAQKMDIVGALAGGIAHDFNNILAGIVSVSSLFKETMATNASIKTDIIKEYVDAIQDGGERAAEMVQKLLGLSKKQEYLFTTVEIQNLTKLAIEKTSHLIDDSVSLKLSQKKKSITVLADRSQFEEVIVNILTNAAHAITVMLPKNTNWGGR